MLRALFPSFAAARVLYAAALGFVILATISWTFIDRIKYPVARFLKDGGAVGALPSFVMGLIRPTDVVLFTLALLLFIVPLYREWRGREVSRALTEGAPVAMAVLLAALLVWFGHAYLDAGYLLAAGYLVFRSTFLPRVIGVLLAIGAVSYLIYSFASFISPEFAARLVPYIQLPSLVGEGSLCLVLLVIGVNVQRWKGQASGAAIATP